LRQAIVEDAGHTADDAPRALLVAADGLAQAVLVRDSAFARVVQQGGPLTSTGRTRRAFQVWTAALDRVERHLRLVGLSRVPAPAETFAQGMRRIAAEAAEERAAERAAADTTGAPTPSASARGGAGVGTTAGAAPADAGDDTLRDIEGG
jgi:hypothetical protein